MVGSTSGDNSYKVSRRYMHREHLIGMVTAFIFYNFFNRPPPTREASASSASSFYAFESFNFICLAILVRRESNEKP